MNVVRDVLPRPGRVNRDRRHATDGAPLRSAAAYPAPVDTMHPRTALAAAAIVGVLALAGCAGTGGGQPASESQGGAATSAPAVTGDAPASEPPAADDGSAVALVTVPSQPGDCAYDPSAFGAVVFTVTADDATTPIELTYTVFRQGAGPDVRTVTMTGPVVVSVQTDCGSQAVSSPWTFTARSATGNSLGCASFFGGKQLASDSDYAEGDVARGVSVDCSGHPGM